MLERLGKFRLSDREDKGVEISLNDTKTSMEGCNRSLVGRILEKILSISRA